MNHDWRHRRAIRIRVTKLITQVLMLLSPVKGSTSSKAKQTRKYADFTCRKETSLI